MLSVTLTASMSTLEKSCCGAALDCWAAALPRASALPIAIAPTTAGHVVRLTACRSRCPLHFEVCTWLPSSLIAGTTLAAPGGRSRRRTAAAAATPRGGWERWRFRCSLQHLFVLGIHGLRTAIGRDQ